MTLHMITHRTWMTEEMSAKQHLGFDLIDTDSFVEGVDALWSPSHYVSLHILSGQKWSYQDTYWWTLPKHLLGRKIVYGSADDISKELRLGDRFVKLARHKNDYFPAKIRSLDQFNKDIEVKSWCPDHEFISSEVIDIKEECRFWSYDGEIVAGDTYRRGDWFYGDENFIEDHEPKDAFYQKAKEVTKYVPGSWSVDIGMDSDGNTFGIEMNPSWCSGWYRGNANSVKKSIFSSQGYSVADPFYPDKASQYILSKNHLLRNSNSL